MDQLAFLFALHAGAQYADVETSQLAALGPRIELEALAAVVRARPGAAFSTAHVDSLDG
jgi:hypothetical protein